ncbi:MAG: hypothetical protein PHH83_03845 [Patescibacteria group bacterium]|nr:hypothetical protein [Patescibacteria group bacterium]
MSAVTKKIVLIILFIVISIGLAFLIYFVFFAKKQIPDEIIVQEQQISGGEFPTAAEGGAKVVEPGSGIVDEEFVSEKIENQTITQEGVIINSKQLVNRDISSINDYSNLNRGIVYYDTINQSFYKVTEDGKISKLSDRKFYSLTAATFSPTKNEAILEYPDKRKVLYDFNKDEFIARFPEQTQDFAFSQQGDKLSYKWIDYYEDQNYLVTSNPDATNFKFIRPILDQAKNIQSIWSPNGEVMATFRKQVDIERQDIYFFNENDKNLRALLVDGFNFEAMWNTKGDKLLYNVTEPRKDYNPVLWVANGQGDGLGYGKASLGVNTWVDKCSFSNTDSNVVYCAVPDYLPMGSGINSSVAEDAIYSIYKINIANGNQELIAQPLVDNNRVSIDKIYTSQDDSQIFYIDKNSGYLYSINLK